MGAVLPPHELIAAQVRAALGEDVGTGDLTAALIPPGTRSRVEIRCREDAVLCGAPWVEEVFRQLPGAVSLHWAASDGDRLAADQVPLLLEGDTRTLLTGERTALNFLQTLSGTATSTRRFVDAVAGTGVRILDTRKTIPGLRQAQKYAVTCGGGANHRMGLYDAILIKENHIEAAGSIAAALTAAASSAPGVAVEIEVESLDELEQALAAGARRVLLDDLDLNAMREAVRLTAGRARLEASGGMTLERVRAVAETGVDDISVGSLTKDVRAVDLSMRFLETY